MPGREQTKLCWFPQGRLSSLMNIINGMLVLGLWALDWVLRSEACKLDTILSSQAIPLLEKGRTSSKQLTFTYFCIIYSYSFRVRVSLSRPG